MTKIHKLREGDFFSGFTFSDVNSVRASSSKVACCHFSSDGKLLASGGHDKKVRGIINFDKTIQYCTF